MRGDDDDDDDDTSVNRALRMTTATAETESCFEADQYLTALLPPPPSDWIVI